MFYCSVVEDDLKFLNNSEIRLKVLVDLLDGPLKIRDINRSSLLSYSSISSNVHKLCEEGYVEKIHNSFQLTNLGFIYITILMDFHDVVTTISNFSDFWLDHDISSLSIFPYMHPEYPKLIRRLILKGVKVELLVSKGILESFVRDIGRDVVKKGLADGNFSLKYLEEDIKIALAISNKFVSVGLFKMDGTYDQNRLLLSDKQKAIDWGLNLFKSYDDNGMPFNLN